MKKSNTRTRIDRDRCSFSLIALVGLSVAMLTVACGGKSSGDTQGGVGQPCYPDDTCDEGLTCISGVCTTGTIAKSPDAGVPQFDQPPPVDIRTPDGTVATFPDSGAIPAADSGAGSSNDAGTTPPNDAGSSPPPDAKIEDPAVCPATTPLGGDCDDKNPCSTNDHWEDVDGKCKCRGDGTATPLGGACSTEGDPCTNNDRWRNVNGSCVCQGDVVDKPLGSACNDGDPCTGNDRHQNVSDQCTCTGDVPPGCVDEPGTCGKKRDRTVCDGSMSCVMQYPGTATACSDGKTCTVNDHCDGAGHCIGTDIGPWRKVAEIYDDADANSTWAAAVRKNWTADQPVKRIRLSGRGATGGYCYTWWGSGNLVSYAAGPGWCSSSANGTAYCTTDSCPASFDNDGNAQLCSVGMGGGDFTLPPKEIAVDLPQGAVINLEERHVFSKNRDWFLCSVEVECTR